MTGKEFRDRIEMLDLKQIEATRECVTRLFSELQIYENFNKAIALYSSSEVQQRLKVTPPRVLEESDTPRPTPEENMATLLRGRGRMVQVMRQTLYDATNKVKQLSDIARKAEAEAVAAQANGDGDPVDDEVETVEA